MGEPGIVVLMWDGGGFRVCGGMLVKLEKTREERKDMIADRNPDLGFTAYDSIHRDQNQYPKQIASFFHQKLSIIFQRSLHGYI